MANSGSHFLYAPNRTHKLAVLNGLKGTGRVEMGGGVERGPEHGPLSN